MEPSDVGPFGSEVHPVELELPPWVRVGKDPSVVCTNVDVVEDNIV